MGNPIPTIWDEVKISPKYKVWHWSSARDSGAWDAMITIFLDRIEGRFLKPIRAIASDRDLGEFSGFAILALDCLLIETLHQFYNGLNETEGDHSKAFWKFFQNSQYFRDSFTKKKASVFYSHFRCGLLHQAQTKKHSLVKIGRPLMIEPVSRVLDNGLIVDREKFHSALESEIKSYLNRLRFGGTENATMREHFIRKMNYICTSQIEGQQSAGPRTGASFASASR